MIVVKNKDDLIKLIIDNPNKYIEGLYPNTSLTNDINASFRSLKLKWNNAIVDYSESLKVRKKINKDFKLLEDRIEKRKINNFISEIIRKGLPKNSFYTNADFGFDFYKNNFELFLDGIEYKGNILCIGTDEHYDYYVISPDFKGVRKVYHDVGEIEDIGIENIEDFAKTAIKFSIIEGSINKGILKKEDIINFIDDIKIPSLKQLIKDNLF